MHLSLIPLLLRKNAEQLALFGATQPVRLTPRAKKRQKLQEQWGQQMSLFGGEGEALTPKAKPKPAQAQLTPKQGQSSGAAPVAVKGRRARKGGEFVAGKRYAGGQWIPKAAFEAQEKGQQYTPQSTTKPPQQKLQIIEDAPTQPGSSPEQAPDDRERRYREAVQRSQQQLREQGKVPPASQGVSMLDALKQQMSLFGGDGEALTPKAKPKPAQAQLTPKQGQSSGAAPAAVESDESQDGDWQQKIDALRERLTGGVRPRGVSAKAVQDALDHLEEQIKTSDGARSYLDRYSALDDGQAVSDLVNTHRAVMRLDRTIADRKKEAEIVNRQGVAAIAGKADQVIGGRSEKAIADFIHRAGLAAKLFEDEEFAVTLKNPPFEDLAIERQGDLLLFTHYYDQNGDRVPDGEIAFQLFPNGQLKLAYTAAHFQGMESRGLDRKFAGVMARNFTAQGFHESATLAGEQAPDNLSDRLASHLREKQSEPRTAAPAVEAIRQLCADENLNENAVNQ
ncbi:MAG: hypothetical protein O3A14_20945, partial [Cyanobacteria bacterium]|nr:hypothetical protein [Cyanobacteriota bacterium]